MEYILSALDTTRQSLLPQMKILEEHYLVDHYDDTYELTTIGKLVVDVMAPLIGIVAVLDTDIDYWGTHDLSFIPSHLFKRINEIRECTLMSPSTEQMYEAHSTVVETSKKYHYNISTFCYPNFKDQFSQILSEGAEMHVIISQGLYDRFRTDSYSDFKELLNNDLVHFYLYLKQMNMAAFVYNEQMVMISPLVKSGIYDNKHIICKSPASINWAKDVFDHYLRESEIITET